MTAQLKRGLSAAASSARKVAALSKLARATHQARSSEEEGSRDGASADRPGPKARSWLCWLLKRSAVVAAVRAAVRS